MVGTLPAREKGHPHGFGPQLKPLLCPGIPCCSLMSASPLLSGGSLGDTSQSPRYPPEPHFTEGPDKGQREGGACLRAVGCSEVPGVYLGIDSPTQDPTPFELHHL